MNNNEILLSGMEPAFEAARKKAESQLEKPGYLAEPWKMADAVPFLRDRLAEEIDEWLKEATNPFSSKENEQGELTDIISIANFLWKALDLHTQGVPCDPQTISGPSSDKPTEVAKAGRHIPAANEGVECPVCSGVGVVDDGYGMETPCLECEGTGYTHTEYSTRSNAELDDVDTETREGAGPSNQKAPSPTESPESSLLFFS